MDSGNYTSDVSTKDLQKARQYAKRKRVAVACTRCKGAKTRCSDYRPCSQCKKSCLADSCDGDSSVYHSQYSPGKDFMVFSPSTPSRPTDMRGNDAVAFPQQETFGDRTAELLQTMGAKCLSHVNKSVVQNLPPSVSAESNGISEAPACDSAMITPAHCGNMVQARAAQLEQPNFIQAHCGNMVQARAAQLEQSSFIPAHFGNMVQARIQTADELHQTILHFAHSIRTPSNLMMLQAQSFQPLPTTPYAPRIHPAWPSPWLLPTPAPPPYSAAALHIYGAPQGTTPQTDALRLMLAALAAKAGAAPLVTPPPLRF